MEPELNAETATNVGTWSAWPIVKGACVVAALIPPIAAVLDRQFWLADLICHFQGPALAATILAFALTVARRRRLAVGLAALAMVQAVPLIRYSGANPVVADPKSSARLRILVANVLEENPRHDDLARLIRDESPDVVGLIECTPEWLADLADVRARYPYRMEYPAGTSGLALWFRDRPETIDLPEWLVPDRNAIIHAVFEFDGRPRHLWLVHPTSPLKLRTWVAGNSELDALARRVAASGGSRIVVGDMNSTDGSAHFRDFLRVSGLRDSRLGFGRQGSWPSNLPFRLPIDHAFVSDDLAVVARRLGPPGGSDHFPLIVDLAPATNAAIQSPRSPVSSR